MTEKSIRPDEQKDDGLAVPEGFRTAPPPPYSIEEAPSNAFNVSHDPELVDLQAEIPYTFRGVCLFAITSPQKVLCSSL